MRSDVFSVSDTGDSEKKKPSSPNRNRTYDLLVISPDVLPLSYKTLVKTKAIKIGPWDKHHAYCYDWNVDKWHIRNDVNVMVNFKPGELMRKQVHFPRMLLRIIHRKKKHLFSAER